MLHQQKEGKEAVIPLISGVGEGAGWCHYRPPTLLTMKDCDQGVFVSLALYHPTEARKVWETASLQSTGRYYIGRLSQELDGGKMTEREIAAQLVPGPLVPDFFSYEVTDSVEKGRALDAGQL